MAARRAVVSSITSLCRCRSPPTTAAAARLPPPPWLASHHHPGLPPLFLHRCSPPTTTAARLRSSSAAASLRHTIRRLHPGTIRTTITSPPSALEGDKSFAQCLLVYSCGEETCTLFPVIGASGFAAAASAAGSVAGSVAVAASFGATGAGQTGSKMGRRTGNVEEFQFEPIGENHNQGRLAVGILVSGFVFEEEDFVRPWAGMEDNLERFALQWESKNLIAVSTTIQDWLTSRLTLELMKRGAMMTVLSTLVTTFAWPATLLAATDFIDSKWNGQLQLIGSESSLF